MWVGGGGLRDMKGSQQEREKTTIFEYKMKIWREGLDSNLQTNKQVLRRGHLEEE